VCLWDGVVIARVLNNKQVQTVSFLVHLIKRGVEGPFMIVAPLSVLGGWIKELSKFEGILYVQYHGTKEQRARIRQLYLRDDPSKWPIIVTSFDVILKVRDRTRPIHRALRLHLTLVA
jgi:ATP-dependent DNA helicase